jgi:hypothetical protein
MEKAKLDVSWDCQSNGIAMGCHQPSSQYGEAMTTHTEGPCEHCGATVGWIPGDRYESAQETIRDLRRQLKAAQASEAAIRNAALEEAARAATGFLVGDPFNGLPLTTPNPHQIAERIRALSTTPAEPGTSKESG